MNVETCNMVALEATGYDVLPCLLSGSAKLLQAFTLWYTRRINLSLNISL